MLICIYFVLTIFPCHKVLSPRCLLGYLFFFLCSFLFCYGNNVFLVFQWGSSLPQGNRSAVSVRHLCRFVHLDMPNDQGIGVWILQFSITLHFNHVKQKSSFCAGERDGSREGRCLLPTQANCHPTFIHAPWHTYMYTYTHTESQTQWVRNKCSFLKSQHFFCSTGSVTWPGFTTHTASLSDICQVRGDFYGLRILNGQDTFMNRESTKTFDPLNVPGFVGFSQSREQWTIFPGHLRRLQRNRKLSPE